MSRKYKVFAIVTALVLVLDQGTKWWIKSNLELWRDHIEVIPGFFQLVHYQNTGAAFGVGSDWGNAMLVFGVFTVICLALVAWMLRALPAEDGFPAAMMALVTGGAVGNAIDRMTEQAVTDFLRFYTNNTSAATWLHDNFGTTEWPSFNIADTAIVTGIIAFIVLVPFMDKSKEEELSEDELGEYAQGA